MGLSDTPNPTPSYQRQLGEQGPWAAQGSWAHLRLTQSHVGEVSRADLPNLVILFLWKGYPQVPWDKVLLPPPLPGASVG